MAERRAAVARGDKGTAVGEGGLGSGKPPWCATSEGKNTHVEVRCSRGWRRSSAVDADGGKVGKKYGESGLDRHPGVGHLLDPRR